MTKVKRKFYRWMARFAGGETERRYPKYSLVKFSSSALHGEEGNPRFIGVDMKGLRWEVLGLERGGETGVLVVAKPLFDIEGWNKGGSFASSWFDPA